MSHAVIRSDFDSAGSAAGFANFTAAAAAVTVSVSRLVFDLVDVLLSLALLTNAALHSLDLKSSVYLLLIYLSYFPNLFFLDETALVFLMCLAIL